MKKRCNDACRGWPRHSWSTPSRTQVNNNTLLFLQQMRVSHTTVNFGFRLKKGNFIKIILNWKEIAIATPGWRMFVLSHCQNIVPKKVLNVCKYFQQNKTEWNNSHGQVENLHNTGKQAQISMTIWIGTIHRNVRRLNEQLHNFKCMFVINVCVKTW